MKLKIDRMIDSALSEEDPAKLQFLLNIVGKAGSGKSLFLQVLTQYVEDLGLPKNFLKLSGPTGTASFLIGGETYHSLCNLPINSNQIHPLKPDALKRLQDRFRGTKILAIDEKSMVSKKMLSFIDFR